MRNQPPHTVPVNEIVGRLLQLWRADNQITLPDESSSVMMRLEFDKDDVEGRIQHLGKQASTAPDIDDLERKLELINDYLDIGGRLEATLSSAVEACRQGKDTGIFTIVLHVEENDPYQHQDGYFTTACIHEWAMEDFNIDIPEWAPPQRTKDDVAIEEPESNSQKTSYTDLDKDKHEVIIALLLEELAHIKKGKYVENDHPNYKQLAYLIGERFEAEGMLINGISGETLRKKFSAAFKTKKRYK